MPKTWQQVNAVSKAVIGKTDPLSGQPAIGYLDPLKGWGGFGFYFLENRAAAYTKHPGDPAWLFDPETMKPRVNNPAWVQAMQDVMDLIATPGAYPADQINADPGTTAFSQFLAGTGSMLMWWGDVGSNARTSDTSVVGDVVGFGINPGSDRVYNSLTGAWEETYNKMPNMASLDWGVNVTNRVSGIFQYYSVAEDELAKGYAGTYKTAQETADAIAAAWEKITDSIGREGQVKLYKASLGM